MIEVSGLDYKVWLRKKLNEAQESLFGERKYDFCVYEDRDFEKSKGKFAIQANTIPVIVRCEGAITQYGVKVTPISIYFLTEENDIESKQVFEAFAEQYNLYREVSDEATSTHTYEAPMITSAFSEALAGYRACYVVGGAISTAEGVADLTALSVTVGSVTEDLTDKIISFSYSYASTLNTEMIGYNHIANSVASASSASISMTMPCVSGDFLNACISQALGQKSGNTIYTFSITIDGISVSGSYRLQSLTFGKTAGEIPSIGLSFAR